MNRRAYLITILTYMLIASTLTVGYFYHQKGRTGDLGPVKALEKISALKADTASDLSNIYGLTVQLEDGKLIVNDSYRTGMQTNLDNYQDYLQGDYATLLRSNISLYPLGLGFSMWPQNITYEYTDENKGATRIHCQNSEIEAYKVSITVTNKEAAEEIQNETSPGTFPFVLDIWNSEGASLLSVDTSLDIEECSEYDIGFGGGDSVKVAFGGCVHLTRALIITSTGTQLENDIEVSTVASNDTRFAADSILEIEAVRNITSSEQVVMSRI